MSCPSPATHLWKRHLPLAGLLLALLLDGVAQHLGPVNLYTPVHNQQHGSTVKTVMYTHFSPALQLMLQKSIDSGRVTANGVLPLTRLTAATCSPVGMTY